MEKFQVACARHGMWQDLAEAGYVWDTRPVWLVLRALSNHECSGSGRVIHLCSLPIWVFRGTKLGLDSARAEMLVHQADRGQGVEGHQNHTWSVGQINGREVSWAQEPCQAQEVCELKRVRGCEEGTRGKSQRCPSSIAGAYGHCFRQDGPLVWSRKAVLIHL